jgi:hypothetical protein
MRAALFESQGLEVADSLALIPYGRGALGQCTSTRVKAFPTIFTRFPLARVGILESPQRGRGPNDPAVTAMTEGNHCHQPGINGSQQPNRRQERD